ncbi:MAG: alanine racemase, partial [Actinomycetota bacterium]
MTTVDPVSVAANVAKVRGRIDASGGEMVKLIAVTKSFGAEAMVAAFDAGCDGVGENYAQELVAKFAEVPAEKRLAVHFIVRLQTNKINLLKNCVDVWQSVDRVELIGEIAKRCNDSEVDRRAKIMLQVNTTNEADKGGCE